MAEPLHIAEGVWIPAASMLVRAVRSGGPGGQNVNKVASKVELRVDLAAVIGMDPQARARLRRMATGSLDADGWLLVTSQKTRDQPRNLEDAREKVRALVARALLRPTVRRPTRPSRGAVERRLSAKKHQSDTKRSRHETE